MIENIRYVVNVVSGDELIDGCQVPAIVVLLVVPAYKFLVVFRRRMVTPGSIFYRVTILRRIMI